MCRNIRTLHNFAPPATEDEVRASALQFVRKLSGFTRPSKANEAAFNRAVDQVTEAAHELIPHLPDTRRLHHVARGVGHYGVFNGSRWRSGIRPAVRDFILAQRDAV